MSDMMSIADMLSHLRADAADERFDGAQLGPTAVRELLRHVDAQAQRIADLEAEIERITEAGRAHIRRAAAFEAQRDALAARLATIEAQPPAAWQSRFTDGGGWGYCSEQHAQMVAAAPHEWPGYEVRALFASPAPAQRVSAADEVPMRCAECGQLGWHKLGCSHVAPCEGGAA